MTARLPLILVACLLMATVQASDEPRFSTGAIHSGSVEFELDISGATRLKLESDGDAATLKWIQRALVHTDGKRIPLEKIPSEDGAYRIADLGFVGLLVKARIENTDKATSQIHVFHDAPRPELPDSITKLEGDPRRGQNVFGRGTCSSCHALAGRGAQVGPDLATLGKEVKLGRLIESLIAPDAALSKGFETNIVTTKDGTPNLGFVVADSEKFISIKDSGGQVHEIKKADVVSRKAQSFSLMPPFGELLTPQQIADLAAFLKAVQR